MGTLTYTTGGLCVLFFWLLWGDFAFSFKERSVPTIVQLLLQRFNASDTLAALLVGTLTLTQTLTGNGSATTCLKLIAIKN